MSKALRLVQITVEHQDCPFFTVFLTIKTLSQNISITLLQILLKLHEHRGLYLRCHCNVNQNKFSSLSDTTVAAIFHNLCL